MILCKRVRAPVGCLSSCTIQWPVTVFRARLHLKTAVRPDPFARLVLDAAALGTLDPAVIARFIDVDPDLIRAVNATLQADGSLDNNGKITEVGQSKRLEIEIDDMRIGWIVRDDLTGASLPWLAETDLRRTAPRPEEIAVLLKETQRFGSPSLGWRLKLGDAVRTHLRLERGGVVGEDDDEPETMADAEARKVGETDIELVGDGIWDELAVDVWFENGPDGPVFRAGCPFGRVGDGQRYAQRIEQVRPRFPLLDVRVRALRLEAEEHFAARADEERDETVRSVIDGLLAGVRARGLPTKVQKEVGDVVLRKLRAERGYERLDKAIPQYGLVAEAVLDSVVPRDWKPDPAWLARWAASLPTTDVAAAQLLVDLIADLLPADDDGVAFEVPEPVRHALPNLLHRLVKRESGGWVPAFKGWPRKLYGEAMIAIPLLASALPAEVEHSACLRVRQVLSADREVWRHLCTMLAHRNDKGAHLHDFPEARLRDALREVAASCDIVLDAFFPLPATS